VIGYNGTIPSRGVTALHADGRRAAQVSFCIQVSNRRQVAEAINASVYYVGQYVNKALNESMEAALSLYPAGMLLIRPLDPGDTIDGTKDWRPAPTEETR
jgi:hypothetical protein